MAKEYKDSGIPWIGEIPKDWRTDRAKTIFVQSTTKGNERLVLQSATQDRGVVDKDTLEGVVQVAADADLRTFKTVHIDDFVISLRSFQGGFEICHNEGVISPAYTVFRLRKKSYTGYYRLLFKSYGFIDKINSLTVGIREGKNIQYRDFADMEIPIPSDVEQQRIAEFLDRKCGEIDEAIALQEEFIEELKAYKQSVITEAVTRGLNPNVKFKDSGIDWIGKIPEGWEVIKVGFLFDNLDYLRQPISAELRERNNPQYDYYGASGVIDKIDHYNVEDKVLLIGEDGANLVLRNLPLIYKAEGRFWVNNHAHILKPKNNNDYNYMAHALEAANYRNYITGSAQPKLSQDNLQAVKLPVPPLSEQKQIADYLDNKCTDIDNLIAIKQQKIEELKDYKKSIIYEYVTGKKEVDG